MKTFNVCFTYQNKNGVIVEDETQFDAEDIDEVKELFNDFAKECGFKYPRTEYIEQVSEEWIG